jgi:hypothetical protein
MRNIPGRIAFRNSLEPPINAIPPLTRVLDIVATTIAREAVFRATPPVFVNSAMDNVMASTSANPAIILERNNPSSPK